MKMLKCFYLFLVICFISLFFIGCNVCDDCDGTYAFEAYFLINKTGKLLYYISNNNDDSLLFDTILLPSDTLFLYSGEFFPQADIFDDPTYFKCRWNEITIKDESQKTLFYRSKTKNCGNEDFVFEIVNNKNHHYWTIDSAYIADKSCNMSWEDFEREYLENE